MKIIVFDTNVWFSHFALNSPTGCALKFYIQNNDFFIGLPEVIETETVYNLKKRLNGFKASIENNFKNMLTIFGELKEIDLPSDEMIESISANIFEKLKDKIIRVPFSFESAKSSYEKIIRKIPPNYGDNQQFKDGAI